ncbi:hypothetical protein [Dulcicalothrix desertica]|uniref:hypothetical protein n=1 Tax=Dulcicalothrix desertica TaxID=32056 RepID=UPI000F8E2F03|nr:hypothetical protein [Dulcicalothrix desertica]TWH62704.1 hypothetical protein CAL7102_00217 [Dulcicalothrix desertica PCC 7102]
MAPVEKRKIPTKCKQCAMLSASQAKEIHGAQGDNCWNPAVCYSRRSHARHSYRRNQARAMRRSSVLAQEISIDIEEFADIYFATLIVYRAPGSETPVHAVGAEVWKGQEKRAVVKPIHCVGMTKSQVLAYTRKLQGVLTSNYGVRKFASLERLDPCLCPIRPCPRNPQT